MQRLESIGTPVAAILMDGPFMFAEGKGVVDAQTGLVWFIPNSRQDHHEPPVSPMLIIFGQVTIPVVLQSKQARHLWLFEVRQVEK